MSHRNSLAGKKRVVYGNAVSAPEQTPSKRKAARHFSSAETLLLFPEPGALESPIQQVMDEWVVPTLARAFLAGRTGNTVTHKPTSGPLGKEI